MNCDTSSISFPKVGPKSPCVMTIAGSDSGGGAGIQADIKTFSMFGVHGTSVIVSVTSQNTVRVCSIYDLPLSVIRSQFNAVCSDMDVAFAKTGMLSSPEITKEVSDMIESEKIPVVVDPIIMSESGESLLTHSSIEVMKKHLLSLAYVVTPNIYEAEILSGIRITSQNDAQKAARIIGDFGPAYVIVTGGHMNATDFIYDTQNEIFTVLPGIPVTGGTHGTGCTYSAALTSCLSLGQSVIDAGNIAKRFVTLGIQNYIQVGRGPSPVNPTGFTVKCRDMFYEIKNNKNNKLKNINTKR